jgi:hypothetical protein
MGRLLAVVAAGLVLAPAGVGAVPPFVSKTFRVSAADLPHSWRPGCPVPPSQLRLLRLSYWGFDGKPYRGAIVVHADVARDVTTVFARLYEQRFPIRRMRTIDAYGGNDSRSTAADNTSAFNCRYAVASGPKHWSQHAYGKAIDVNPVENPYVFGGRALPEAGRAYADRSRHRPGMAVTGGILVEAFRAVGWHWGGLWRGSPDYQHFSTTGT